MGQEVSKKERLLALIHSKTHGKGQTAFGRLVGLPQGTIGGWISPNTFDTDLILRIFPDVSAEWLLRGEGNMLKENPQEKTILPASLNDLHGIPLIPVEAMAGVFKGEETVLLQECERYIVPSFNDADFLIHVRGDSMELRYFSGDLIACKFVSMGDLFFQWGKVYVINTEQGALIKKVMSGGDKTTIRLVSENESYPPFEVPLESIHQLTLVKGLIRTE